MSYKYILFIKILYNQKDYYTFKHTTIQTYARKQLYVCIHIQSIFEIYPLYCHTFMQYLALQDIQSLFNSPFNKSFTNLLQIESCVSSLELVKSVRLSLQDEFYEEKSQKIPYLKYMRDSFLCESQWLFVFVLLAKLPQLLLLNCRFVNQIKILKQTIKQLKSSFKVIHNNLDKQILLQINIDHFNCQNIQIYLHSKQKNKKEQCKYITIIKQTYERYQIKTIDYKFLILFEIKKTKQNF
eukprot:TRINITY_DN3270_c0_g1_i5.p4 TRINITY_DN3270_c0_g1~~TRINITY_DN3270_c0_g1_i5.p4  ORF type:complete len:240 (+),score=-9.10 TRINITY_DN3270_c0_g1_i5:359-1078(+)